MRELLLDTALLLLLAAWPMATCSQSSGIDSVKKVLQTQKADTKKVHSLVQLGYLYAGSHPDTGPFMHSRL